MISKMMSNVRFLQVGFGNQQPPKETRPKETRPKETRAEMLKRHSREALAARSAAGGGDPRHTNVPPDVAKRHAHELATLEGKDTRYGTPS
jgi:hypothetical protein